MSVIRAKVERYGNWRVVQNDEGTEYSLMAVILISPQDLLWDLVRVISQYIIKSISCLITMRLRVCRWSRNSVPLIEDQFHGYVENHNQKDSWKPILWNWTRFSQVVWVKYPTLPFQSRQQTALQRNQMQYLPTILVFLAAILNLAASSMWQPDIRWKRVVKWSAAASVFAVLYYYLCLGWS